MKEAEIQAAGSLLPKHKAVQGFEGRKCLNSPMSRLLSMRFLRDPGHIMQRANPRKAEYS